MGNGSIIRPGDVQRMSAGTGVKHSEANPSRDEPVHLLQIWIEPNVAGIAPGYEEKHFAPASRRGRLRLIASSDGREGSVLIHQDAAVYAGISPPRIIVQAMLLSGALAGCLGVNELLGSQHRILIDFPGGAGFVGIAVALMGRNHPFGIFIAAVLFGALAQGGSQLAFDLPKINRDMVVVIQGLVILFCGALENVFRAPLAMLFKEKAQT